MSGETVKYNKLKESEIEGRKRYYYICSHCGEKIKQRLDIIKNMKNQLCKSCSNKIKGKKYSKKISESLKKYWNNLSEYEKSTLTSHLLNDYVREKAIDTLRERYSNGDLKAWNDGINVQTNTGNTHIKEGQHLSPGTEFKSGTDNRHWKEDRSTLKTPRMKLIRDCGKYRNWRESVFRKDDYICQICNQIGSELNAHHIKSFSKLISQYNITDLDDAINCDELWDINNGITLCNNCHKWVHSIDPLNQQ